jgi:3-methyladenine DNA glycosylase AlkD
VGARGRATAEAAGPAGADGSDRAAAVLVELRRIGDASRLPGMARYGINVDRALGVSIPDLRRIARGLRPDHDLALALWATGVHEARILASMADDPARVTSAQMQAWARDFDSWDLCDQVCANLFVDTRHAFAKAETWSRRRATFVTRAGFSLIAAIAVHRKDVDDERVAAFLPLIEARADDDRNYVWKAVNWALRQIGKRSPALNAQAIATAERIRARGTRAGRRIANDALRELSSDAVRGRFEARAAAATARTSPARARAGRPGTRLSRPRR